MRLTTRGRYAVTAMLDLALHGWRGPVSLADIARRQALPLSYLEQLFARMRRSALVGSVRGPGGGYALRRPADEVFVAEIIAAVDESVDTTKCGGGGDCRDGETCLTHYLWEDLSRQIRRFLGGVSLADLAARTDIRRVAERQRRREEALAGGRPAAMRVGEPEDFRRPAAAP